MTDEKMVTETGETPETVKTQCGVLQSPGASAVMRGVKTYPTGNTFLLVSRKYPGRVAMTPYKVLDRREFVRGGRRVTELILHTDGVRNLAWAWLPEESFCPPAESSPLLMKTYGDWYGELDAARRWMEPAFDAAFPEVVEYADGAKSFPGRVGDHRRYERVVSGYDSRVSPEGSPHPRDPSALLTLSVPGGGRWHLFYSTDPGDRSPVRRDNTVRTWGDCPGKTWMRECIMSVATANGTSTNGKNGSTHG